MPDPDLRATGLHRLTAAPAAVKKFHRGATEASPRVSRPHRDDKPQSTPSGSPAGRARGAVGTAVAATVTQPTYEQLCGPQPTGAPAPDAIASLLAGVFLREGAVQAGCAKQPSRVESPAGEVWVMPGMCGSRLSSLAIASPDGSSGILLGEQASGIGLSLAVDGALQAISVRTTIRGGDFYTVTTRDGVDLLIRRRSSVSSLSQPARSCDELPPAAAAYVLMPPTLAARWLALAERRFTWPTETGRDGTQRRFAFVSDSTAPVPIASGHCELQRCTVTLADGTPFVAETKLTPGTVVARSR